MNRKLLLQNSLRIMLRNKLRTLFMGIGVMIGVGTLIAGQSLGAGAEKAAMDAGAGPQNSAGKDCQPAGYHRPPRFPPALEQRKQT
jgi:hypothetical protein